MFGQQIPFEITNLISNYLSPSLYDMLLVFKEVKNEKIALQIIKECENLTSSQVGHKLFCHRLHCMQEETFNHFKSDRTLEIASELYYEECREYHKRGCRSSFGSWDSMSTSDRFPYYLQAKQLGLFK